MKRMKRVTWTWGSISSETGLSEEFMREHKDKLIWNLIAQFQTLSETFLIEMEGYVEWFHTSAFQPLTPSLIDRYSDCIAWDLLSQNKHLTTELMIQYKDDLNWNRIYFHHPEKFKKIKDIVGAENRIDWDRFHIDAYHKGKMDNTFLLQYKERLDWTHILRGYIDDIDPSILEQVNVYIDWDELSSKRLKETHLEKLQNYLNWDSVSTNTKIEFTHFLVLEYANQLNIPLLLEHHLLEEGTLGRLHIYKKNIWEKVATHQKPSFNFTEAFVKKIDIEEMKRRSPTLYTEEQWNILFEKKKETNWNRTWKIVKKLLKRA